MKKKILLLLLILMIIFIWGQSFLSKASSANESRLLYQLLKPFLDRIFGPGTVTRDLLRKIAHFTEFAGLGVILSFILKNRQHGFLWAAGFAFLTAFLDETIQIFSRRGPMIADVWLDLFGALSVEAVLFLIFYLRNRHRQRGVRPHR